MLKIGEFGSVNFWSGSGVHKLGYPNLARVCGAANVASRANKMVQGALGPF